MIVRILTVLLLIAAPGPVLADEALPPDSEYLSNLDQIEIQTDLPASVVEEEDGIATTGNESDDGVAEDPATQVTGLDTVEETQPIETEPLPVAEETQDKDAALEDVVTAENEEQPTEESAAATVEPAVEQEATESAQTAAVADTAETEPPVADAQEAGQQPETEPTESAEEQVAAANPESTTQDESTVSADTDKGLETTLQHWAMAWSAQDLQQYLSFYSDRFQPANNGLSRKEWEKQRESRLLAPSKINVTIANIKIEPGNDNSAQEVTFEQHYQSNTYEDKIIKSIHFVKQDNSWKIVSETTIETL